MNILSFDTGLNLGWSIIDIDTQKLIEYGIKKFDLSEGVGQYCDDLWGYFSNFYYDIDVVRIEMPEFYGDKKGIISAKRGDLFVVHASAITIHNVFRDCPAELIKPKEWKGQMNKEATENRVKIIMGDQINNILKLPKYKKEHILDSIGIGLSYDKELWSLRKE